jgi:hypothetical protein
MRISADHNDPGYAAYEAMRFRGRMPEILLDGQIIQWAVWADDEVGELERLVVESQKPSGGLPTFAVKNGRFATELMRGKVQIVERSEKGN